MNICGVYSYQVDQSDNYFDRDRLASQITRDIKSDCAIMVFGFGLKISHGFWVFNDEKSIGVNHKNAYSFCRNKIEDLVKANDIHTTLLFIVFNMVYEPGGYEYTKSLPVKSIIKSGKDVYCQEERDVSVDDVDNILRRIFRYRMN